MTIDDIKGNLNRERDFGSRFPARIIFVEDLESYSALVAKLRIECDCTINIADFGKNDVVPQFDKMRESLSKYEGKQILLLSVGEYLRICIKRELNTEMAQFPSFWETMQQETSKTRYIMPVFSCRDSFDRIIGKVDERQADFVWTLESDHVQLKQYDISVYSPEFAGAINADANNFEVWLRRWDTILNEGTHCAIITNQYRNVEASYGNIVLKPIDSPFAYLVDLLQEGDKIEKNWEPDVFWAKLIPYAKKDMKFSDVILDQLNITSFDFVSVIARWAALSDMQHELIWLWYRIYPTDEYYSYVCNKAQKADNIPDGIRDDILHLSSRSQCWIEERMKAMKVLSFASYDEEYFKALEKLPITEVKFQLLTYKTHEERTFAIKIVSELLRNGVEPETIAEMLKDRFPILSTYLCKKSGIDSEIDDYLSWYRRNKLINRFSGNYPKTVSCNRFDARFKQLYKMNGKNCFTFWIDGFGIEWLPVFLQNLELRGIIPESSKIVTAKLPTETIYNYKKDKNNLLQKKWDKLDSFSHKGMPDDKSYYSCIAYQLSVFSEAAKEVDELLNSYEYVAITGDHGSSRIAALAFHDNSVVPVTAPSNSKVFSFGRFCELTDDDNFIVPNYMEKINLDDKIFLVMKDYNHFAVSGNAAGGNTDENDVVGEIHGGGTPEERLVPLIIVKRSQPLPQLICKPKSKFVTRKHDHIEFNLEFNRKVFSLEASIDSKVGICTLKSDETWDVSFDGIDEEELQVSIVANGNLLDKKVDLKVKSQGIGQNSGMGGLP